MKRKLLVLVMALASVAALTGCEKKEDKKEEGTTTVKTETKTLACSVTDDEETLKFTFTFEGETYNKVVLSETTKYKSEKDAKAAYEDDKEEVKEMNNYKGISANAQQSGSSTYNTATFKLAELDDNSKTIYNQVFKEVDGKSYDTIKADLEKAGYTCK